MAAEPVWTARAEADLVELYVVLEEASPGRGERFLRAVDSGVRL